MEDCCGALRPCDSFAPRSLQRGRAARQGDAPRKRGRALPPAGAAGAKILKPAGAGPPHFGCNAHRCSHELTLSGE